jgi:hypothetical protein
MSKKFVMAIIALFAYFKCICSKTANFSDILQKVKTYCVVAAMIKVYFLNFNVAKWVAPL